MARSKNGNRIAVELPGDSPYGFVEIRGHRDVSVSRRVKSAVVELLKHCGRGGTPTAFDPLPDDLRPPA